MACGLVPSPMATLWVWDPNSSDRTSWRSAAGQRHGPGVSSRSTSTATSQPMGFGSLP